MGFQLVGFGTYPTLLAPSVPGSLFRLWSFAFRFGFYVARLLFRAVVFDKKSSCGCTHSLLFNSLRHRGEYRLELTLSAVLPPPFPGRKQALLQRWIAFSVRGGFNPPPHLSVSFMGGFWGSFGFAPHEGDFVGA